MSLVWTRGLKAAKATRATKVEPRVGTTAASRATARPVAGSRAETRSAPQAERTQSQSCELRRYQAKRGGRTTRTCLISKTVLDIFAVAWLPDT